MSGVKGKQRGGCAHVEQTLDLVTGPGPHKTSLHALLCLLSWQPGRLECEPPVGRGGGLHRQLGSGHDLGHLASIAPGGEWAQWCGQLHLFPACGPWELREVAGFSGTLSDVCGQVFALHPYYLLGVSPCEVRSCSQF